MSLRAAVLVLLIGCRGPIAAHVDASPADTGSIDAAIDARVPDAPGDVLDGTPMRRPCTGTFGSALPQTTFGRMDGFLVAVVSPGSNTACHADTTHVHLQVLVNGAVYDVAVNVGTNDATNDVHSATLDHALIGPAWSEGFHTGITVDYPTLGVHADAIPLHTQTENVTALMTDLATANHVSIYATSYTTDDGAHLVHRHTNSLNGTDGLVVTKPLSPTAHARLFSFTSQTF